VLKIMGASQLEIHCPACGKITLLRREPVYEGFQKTGEKLFCSECGAGFASEEETPFVADDKTAIFTDADRSQDVEIFKESEKRRYCHYCANYVVNPFMQWCSFHKKEVEATDTCDRFVQAKGDEPEGSPA
jgi:ribosomal protein S27E